MLGKGLTCRRCYGLSSLHNRIRYNTTLTTSVKQQDEPLRILFCGSEAFSITALEALHAYSKKKRSNILSIDVAARKDKPSGRGLKELRAPPIKRVAKQLDLPLHQFDTFTGWNPPEYDLSPQPYINLVIAVSFGLLVPPRMLKQAKFGGLNVHPSMLPSLRGAAPINWTIIRGHSSTGVTVQTLHPSKFDHGVILSQTPMPGISLPNPDEITSHELRLLLAPIAAKMLVQAIDQKLYLQPFQEVKTHPLDWPNQLTQPAPKITPSMKRLDPLQDDATTILRKNRGMPKLWAEITTDASNKVQKKRLIMGTGMRTFQKDDLPAGEVSLLVNDIPIGVPFSVVARDEDIHHSGEPILVKVRDGGIIAISTLLVAGGREGSATSAAAHAKLFKEPILSHSHNVYRFHRQLDTLDTVG